MMKTTNDYGVCERCGCDLEPIFYTAEEEKVTEQGWRYKTGRKRRAVSHLECPGCFKNYCVDDSFDGPWY